MIAGPRRFTDLLDGLPGISTNLLSERLKQLEQQGLIRRRMLPPPAGSAVYELTTVAQALEPTLLELGKWGSQFVPASREGAALLHANSYALTLKTFFRPERAQGLDETMSCTSTMRCYRCGLPRMGCWLNRAPRLKRMLSFVPIRGLA